MYIYICIYIYIPWWSLCRGIRMPKLLNIKMFSPVTGSVKVAGCSPDSWLQPAQDTVWRPMMRYDNYDRVMISPCQLWAGWTNWRCIGSWRKRTKHIKKSTICLAAMKLIWTQKRDASCCCRRCCYRCCSRYCCCFLAACQWHVLLIKDDLQVAESFSTRITQSDADTRHGTIPKMRRLHHGPRPWRIAHVRPSWRPWGSQYPRRQITTIIGFSTVFHCFPGMYSTNQCSMKTCAEVLYVGLLRLLHVIVTPWPGSSRVTQIDSVWSLILGPMRPPQTFPRYPRQVKEMPE